MIASLPTPLTEQAQTISDVWNLFLIGAAAVGGLILILVGIIVIRFRRQGDRLPEQIHYRIGLEVAYTLIPLVAIVGLFAVTLTSLRSVKATVAEPDLVVEVQAFQWQWHFRYPESGVIVGQADGSTNPELVLPRGAVVQFDLESSDVIHSFWVPGFLYKRDILPGDHQTMQVDVSGEPGVYPAVCAEFCGLGHTGMRFTVRILDAAEFDSWLTEMGSQP